jgi:type I restriction enzyme M protein
MTDNSNRLVGKLWSYCHVLRDDGLSYQDYLEQLTFLLFLKMADERVELIGGENPVPEGYRWSDLSAPDMVGTKLEEHYRNTALPQYPPLSWSATRNARPHLQQGAE